MGIFVKVPSPLGSVRRVFLILFFPQKAESLYCWWKSKFCAPQSNIFQNVKWLMTLEPMLVYYHKERALLPEVLLLTLLLFCLATDAAWH